MIADACRLASCNSRTIGELVIVNSLGNNTARDQFYSNHRATDAADGSFYPINVGGASLSQKQTQWAEHNRVGRE